MEEPIQINIGKWTILFILISMLLFIFPIIDISVGAFNLSLIFTEPWRLITSMFLHASVPHLFYNIVSLFIFGNLIEIHYGSKFFVTLSLISGIIGTLFFGILEPTTYSVGISGVIFGLIGASVILVPDAKALMPIGIISVPAKVKIAGPFIAIGEFILGFFPSTVGHHAHFGGFFGGIILGYYIKKTSKIKNKLSHEEFHLEEIDL